MILFIRGWVNKSVTLNFPSFNLKSTIPVNNHLLTDGCQTSGNMCNSHWKHIINLKKCYCPHFVWLHKQEWRQTYWTPNWDRYIWNTWKYLRYHRSDVSGSSSKSSSFFLVQLPVSIPRRFLLSLEASSRTSVDRMKLIRRWSEKGNLPSFEKITRSSP